MAFQEQSDGLFFNREAAGTYLEYTFQSDKIYDLVLKKVRSLPTRNTSPHASSRVSLDL